MSERDIREQGAAMRERCRGSKWLAPYADLEGRDAIKLFFASEPQIALQMVTPEARWRLEWVKGWDGA